MSWKEQFHWGKILIEIILAGILNGLKRLVGISFTCSSDLYYKKDSKVHRFFLEHCKALKSKFSPPWWLANKHSQTTIPPQMQEFTMEWKREYMQVSDGGQISLDWAVTDNVGTSDPICFVLCGLAGYIGDAKYVGLLARDLSDNGFRVVVFNRRGHGNTPLTSPMYCSFVDPRDFKEAVEEISQRYPNAKLTAAGVCTGASMMLSYLGRISDKCPLVAATGFASGFDHDAKNHGEGIIPEPYDSYELFYIKEIFREHAEMLKEKVDINEILSLDSVLKFELGLHSKLTNHAGMYEYWDNYTPMKHFKDIKVPTLIINARDDPVFPDHLIPYGDFEKHEYAMLLATDLGGHYSGYYMEEVDTAGQKKMFNWANRVAVDYLLSALDQYRTNERFVQNGSA